MEKLDQTCKPEKRISVGEEFCAWAEQYWRLKEHYDKTTQDPSEKTESLPSYEEVKKIFARKIDETITMRLKL